VTEKGGLFVLHADGARCGNAGPLGAGARRGGASCSARRLRLPQRIGPWGPYLYTIYSRARACPFRSAVARQAQALGSILTLPPWTNPGLRRPIQTRPMCAVVREATCLPRPAASAASTLP